MLINKLYRQQRLLSVLLTFGMLLQMAVPLLDGSLVYRFSNWLTHESSLEIAQIQQLRTQAHSIEELALAVASSTVDSPTTSEKANPKADFFLKSFLAQSDAQRATKEAATATKVPTKPLSLLVSSTNATLGFSPIGIIVSPFTKYGSLNALFELRKHALSGLGNLSFPPASGQSTLAP